MFVEFNISGYHYICYKNIFNSEPNSYLYKLINSKNINIDNDKNNKIFIDRDGKLFYHILNYYRDVQYTNILQYISIEKLEVLLIEADYYLLNNFSSVIKHFIKIYKDKHIEKNMLLCIDIHTNNIINNNENKNLNFYLNNGWIIKNIIPLHINNYVSVVLSNI